MIATWSKNKQTDRWSVRVTLEDPFETLPASGSDITVTKKSGETTEVKLGRRVWEGDNDGSPVAIYSLD